MEARPERETTTKLDYLLHQKLTLTRILANLPTELPGCSSTSAKQPGEASIRRSSQNDRFDSWAGWRRDLRLLR